MKNVIMVDNSPQAYSWQKENGIPIISWFGNTRDNQLNKLIPVLQRLAEVDDVREYIPKIIGAHSVNYYEAFKVLKAPRESSPLDSIFNTLTKFKRNAAAFFSGNPIQETSSDEEEKEDREYSNEEIKRMNENSSPTIAPANQDEYIPTDLENKDKEILTISEIPLIQRSKPTSTKVEPKIATINLIDHPINLIKSYSKASCDETNGFNEFDILDNSNEGSHMQPRSSKIVAAEAPVHNEDIKVSYKYIDGSEDRRDSGERQEDTNISAFKNSISSYGNQSKSNLSPLSSERFEKYKTPDKDGISLSSENNYNTQSPSYEVTENCEIPEAPQPQKLKSSNYIKHQFLANKRFDMTPNASEVSLKNDIEEGSYDKVKGFKVFDKKFIQEEFERLFGFIIEEIFSFT